MLNAENTAVKVVGSTNQWPMSGGPDGSWRVETDLEIPVEWSVRENKNIKWKKALPAGGQSGIAVWGDQIFFTINPPIETPAFAGSKAKHDRLKAVYDRLFSKALKQLVSGKDSVYLNAVAFKERTEADFETFLTADEAYQKAKSGCQKKRLRSNYLKKHAKGKAVSKATQGAMRIIHTSFSELNEAYREMKKAHSEMTRRGRSADVVLISMDANSGEMLWERTVSGLMSSGYNYGFSDSTTPCPITDGEHVWAINSSGGMACFTVEGSLVWKRTWMPTGGRPFNKQFDSIIYGDRILNMEPPVEGDSVRIADWNYLHAFDKKSGERVWVSDAALTHYNTPVIGQTADGTPAVLIARGGPHGVPERPIGMSLVKLKGPDAGQSIWEWKTNVPNKLSGFGAVSTMLWDGKSASWFYKGVEHLSVDSNTGELLTQKPLRTVDQYAYDLESKKHVLAANTEFTYEGNLRHCNMQSGDHIFYLYRDCPFVARHNTVTGKTEMVEVPREFDASGHYVWGEAQGNDGLNSKGQLLGCDRRTQGSGFQKCFLGTPTLVNDMLFITNAVGLVYVIDTKAEPFDASAIVAVNDLGEQGQTWTVNSLSFANGHIYHRTMKEIICIETP